MNVIEEGVYFLYNDDELVYIGESDNLYRRIGQHIASKEKIFNRFELYPTTDRKRLEGFLIRMFKPKYNVASGANYDFRGIGADYFPSLSIQEAIKKYDEYMGDPLIAEISDDIGTYQECLLRGLTKANAPVYRLNGHFRLDKEWYNAHINDIWDYVD